MGLDSVELVMEFEETFGVDLMDDEAIEKTTTPRMVGDLIFSKLKQKGEGTCQSQQAFYPLRNVFCKMFDLDRRSIRPDMRFRDLIPREREKEMWDQIRTAISARRWPDLERPSHISRFIDIVGLAILVTVICTTAWGIWKIRPAGLEGTIDALLSGVSIGFIVGLLLAGLFWAVAYRLTDRFEVYIPARFQSVRDIVPYAVSSERIKWTREGVSHAIKEIVVEQMGLDGRDYTEDSRFVEDFGVN